MLNDTICAISTALKEGAISIVRMSGDESFEIIRSGYLCLKLENIGSEVAKDIKIRINDEFLDNLEKATHMIHLRETTEAAMYDAIVVNTENEDKIKIDQQKFIESFLKRFADNASLSRTYKIDIYDINEEPPKVSLKVSSTETGNSEIVSFDLVNKVDAILETTY